MTNKCPNCGTFLNAGAPYSQIIEAFNRDGWTSEQLRKDGVQIWVKDKAIRISYGDWAKITDKELIDTVKNLYLDHQVECDAEIWADKTWTSVPI